MKGAENEQTKIRCSKCVRVNQAPKLWDENATAIFELAAHCSLVRTIKLPLSKVTRCNDETARKAALVEYKTLTKMCGWVNVAFDRKSELYRQKASIQFHVASFETGSFAGWYSQQVLLNYLQLAERDSFISYGWDLSIAHRQRYVKYHSPTNITMELSPWYKFDNNSNKSYWKRPRQIEKKEPE